MMFKPQNNNRLIWAPIFATIALTTACSGSGSSGSSSFTGTDLASKNFMVDEALATVSFAGGKTLSLSQQAGSGAYQSPSESFDQFYTVSDRGPSIDCADTESVIEVADFCGVGVSGEVFPLPSYTPQITQWQLSGQGSELSLEKVATIALSDSAGAAIDGLPNRGDEKAFDADGNALPVSPNGLDPEAIVKLANGNFWLADDYGPSLVLVAADGEILERHVPAGTLADYSGASYPVSDTLLPEVFAKRQQQGGIAALALSPDNQFLYFIMKRPLANPNEESVGDSRIVRIGKLSLDDAGAISALDGEYLYRLDSPSQFARKHDGSGDLVDGEFLSQGVVTVNEAVALAEDYLAVVEQADTVSKFYRINLANAVSVLGSDWDSLAASPSLEQQYVLADTPFVPKQLAFESLSSTLPVGISALPTGLEGLAFLNGNFTVHSNDNNYGIAGGSSELTVLPLGALIAVADAPLMPSIDYAESASFKRDDAVFDSGSAAGVAADVVNTQMFVVNAQLAAVDVLDISDPLAPTLTAQLDLAAAATDAGMTIGAVNSVVVGLSHVAVALGNSDPQASGSVALFALDDLSFSASFAVGAMPRALAFDFLGRYVLVANEGAPSDDYSVDPEGSVTVIDIEDGVDVASVTNISFSDFNADGTRADELPSGVRITGPGASVAQDLEPEFITVALDNSKFYVSLQENNAVAVVDMATLTIDAVQALGSKDFGSAGNELDVRNDGVVDIRSWAGLQGVYQPGGLTSYLYRNDNYLVTANEGAARRYSGFNEAFTAVEFDGVAAPAIDAANPSVDAAADEEQLGGLTLSDQTGDTDGDGDIDQMTAFGGRSFSIWDNSGQLVFDSGADLARLTSAISGDKFNDLDSASDESGAAPNSLALIGSNGRIYAFVALGRSSGIAIYDVTSPYGVQFVQYVNNRDFSLDASADSGDVGPEGLDTFAVDGVTYLAVGHTGSGNVRIFAIDANGTAP